MNTLPISKIHQNGNMLKSFVKPMDLNSELLQISICSNKRHRLAKSDQYWINKFTKIHGDKYTYNFIEDNLNKVQVFCTIHRTYNICLKNNIGMGHGVKCCKDETLRKNINIHN